MDEEARRKHRAELNRTLRQQFIKGAEERSRRALGRGLTKEELERVLRRYPGDLPEPSSVVTPDAPVPSEPRPATHRDPRSE